MTSVSGQSFETNPSPRAIPVSGRLSTVLERPVMVTDAHLRGNDPVDDSSCRSSMSTKEAACHEVGEPGDSPQDARTPGAAVQRAATLQPQDKPALGMSAGPGVRDDLAHYLNATACPATTPDRYGPQKPSGYPSLVRPCCYSTYMSFILMTASARGLNPLTFDLRAKISGSATSHTLDGSSRMILNTVWSSASRLSGSIS